MHRNISRIKAMMTLYCYDLTGNRLEEKVFDNLIREESEEYYQADDAFFKELVDGVIEHLTAIDKVINLNLENYLINRLSFVDRNLIRIAVYEMKYMKTAKAVVINEILDIAREYSQTDDFNSVAFNNSLLDKISKSMEL